MFLSFFCGFTDSEGGEREDDESDESESWGDDKHHDETADDSREVSDNLDELLGEGRGKDIDIVRENAQGVAESMLVEVRNWEARKFVDDFFAEVFCIEGGKASEKEAFKIAQDGNDTIKNEELECGEFEKSEVERAGFGDTFNGRVGHVTENFRAEESEEIAGDGEDEREEKGEFVLFERAEKELERDFKVFRFSVGEFISRHELVPFRIRLRRIGF